MSKKKPSEFVYQCAFTGENFEPDDKRLLGLGFPPRSPAQPVGTGSTPMSMIRNPDIDTGSSKKTK